MEANESKEKYVCGKLEPSELILGSMKLTSSPCDSDRNFESNDSEIQSNTVIVENSKTQSWSKNLDSSEVFHHENSDAVVFSGANKYILTEQSEIDNSSNRWLDNVVGELSRPLCADYKSDSKSEDSESDSSTLSTGTGTVTETSSESEEESDESYNSSINRRKTKLEGKESKKDLLLSNLPPIEDLKISVPEEDCIAIGTITSIVETLVVVESYKGTPALDLETVLFLDCGKRTLGKVFDILGPITEPIYTVRFNSQEQIHNLKIEKNQKVYYAPKTPHTTFVFMSEVLKIRGSDASWKDNSEVPPEFQDYSDDEEERQHKNKQIRDSEGESTSLKEQNKQRKRPFNKTKPSSGILQPSRFRNPCFYQQRPSFVGNSSTNQFSVPIRPFSRATFCDPVMAQSYPPPSPLSVPSHIYFPPRLTGPPFPVFRGFPPVHQSQNFQQPFYQQRTQTFCHNFGAWGRPILRLPPPPPPPPPPTTAP